MSKEKKTLSGGWPPPKKRSDLIIERINKIPLTGKQKNSIICTKPPETSGGGSGGQDKQKQERFVPEDHTPSPIPSL